MPYYKRNSRFICKWITVENKWMCWLGKLCMYISLNWTSHLICLILLNYQKEEMASYRSSPSELEYMSVGFGNCTGFPFFLPRIIFWCLCLDSIQTCHSTFISVCFGTCALRYSDIFRVRNINSNGCQKWGKRRRMWRGT